STLASALAAELRMRGTDVAVLESDALRRVLTPRPAYSEEERDTFYLAMAFIGKLLVEHGVPVIFDATASRRIYRDSARRQIARFLEVYVDCPLGICLKRDSKGIYKRAQEGAASTVPGLQAAYEPPQHPDLVVHGDRELPQDAGRRVLAKLVEKHYLEEHIPAGEGGI
ncbi:MAG: adenylyl-sulfate kinase, partial [Acidobacteria bacterium]|nr:adenylyl-sulfate kinase [Acidobacteriota bacterium]